jgi:hypothetical protein
LHKFNVEDLISDIRNRISHVSSTGFDQLHEIFNAIDEQNTKQLDADDFRWGFIDFGFNLSKEEAEQLVNAFDKKKSGTINYEDFLNVLRVSTHSLFNKVAGNLRWIPRSHTKMRAG